MQNVHRHSSYSNIATPDSVVLNEEYAKRAVEIGHKVISSVEHGWQGFYFETYELGHKYNLKTVIGAEAYWVKDRTDMKDKSNNHVLILAKSNQGREALNDILSEANLTGYYYKPRVDIPLLLSLPPKDVVVTTACIAFNGYDDIDNVIFQLHDHFQDNFFLEIQYHNTEKQKEWNRHLKALADSSHMQMSVGLDSHYIYDSDANQRDWFLESKKMQYADESGWYMDYPDDDTTIKRFQKQGIFTDDEIKNAMDATDIALDFCDYDNVRIFTKDIKLPSLYKDLTEEEKNEKYRLLIAEKFKQYSDKIPSERYQEYYDGVQAEINTYKDTGMCDYPLLDYAIVKDAVEHGGLITDTGRGSAVGFFTNTLCGFSKIDRFTSAIKLYPERFISTTRILQTKSLPDIDLNVGTPEIFEEAQIRVLGEEHVAPMIAFGTFKRKSAFKMYARAKNMDFDLANEISQQLTDYEEALKNADDDEKDLIDLYDYVDEKYKKYIDASDEYRGIIVDKKKAPSAYLLYDGNIRREIGLIKCKSATTKKEYITCVINGAVAEDYKFLKNDILKVDVVLLIDKVFKRIGIEHFDVDTLLEKSKDDKKVWALYANGYTVCVNQLEKIGSTQKCMRYKPKNISELSAFIAAIRPGFKSMYQRFENREDFSWGIPSLDRMLRTEELPVSFLFFQEQVMAVLNYAGFPMDECYGIIKAIAKKHPEKVKPLKSQFIDGCREQLIKDEDLSVEDAQKSAEAMWVIVNDNCGYSYNSAHAYSMGCDSLYQAWQKANYPYEFYEVMLQHYSDKGNKDKVALIKSEMKRAFNISEGAYRFREDNRRFVLDKEHHCIHPSLLSIKGIGQNVAEDLYAIKDKSFVDYYDLLDTLKGTTIKKNQLETLIKLQYFSEFGGVNELLKKTEIYNNLRKRKQIKLVDLSKLGVELDDIKAVSKNQTEKMFKDFDSLELIRLVSSHTEFAKTSIVDLLSYEQEYLGYVSMTIPTINENYYMVMDISVKKTRILTLYRIMDGQMKKIKVRAKTLSKEPLNKTDILFVTDIHPEKKWRKDENDNWYQIDEYEEILGGYRIMQRKN